MLAWWAKDKQKEDYGCLAVVASELFGFKPGSGGLECDIGGVGDVVSPKRSSLQPGMVEVAMFIKLNKDLIEQNPTKVDALPKKYMEGPYSWSARIPTRLFCW